MLMACQECSGKVSDKATYCPHCGFPVAQMDILSPIEIKAVKSPNTKSRRTKHPKLPNGFGHIQKLSGTRRKPYACYAPILKHEYDDNGKPPKRQAVGCFETWYEAYEHLSLYNKNPEAVDKQSATFKEVYEMWYKDKFENPFTKREFSESSKKNYAWGFKYCKALHDKKMIDIHKSEMQSILDNCPLSYASHENLVKLFGQLFKFSIHNGIVETDYSKFITINMEDNTESGVPFTADEIKKLWAHTEIRYVKETLILIYSGLRIGELKVVEINLDDMTFKGGLKTKASKERYVPIHPFIQDFVREFNQEKFSVGAMRDKGMFQRTLEKCGISPNAITGEKHTPHDCRHTFSWLCDSCEQPIDNLSKHLLMAHSLGSDIEMNTYGHRTMEQLRTELNKINIR